MITAKINLGKLDKAVITTGKSGQPLLVIDINGSHLFKSDNGAVYLDLLIFENEDKKYSDYSIKQSVSKEQREADKAGGYQRPFLGNASVFVPKEEGAQEVKPEESDLANDLPF